MSRASGHGRLGCQELGVEAVGSFRLTPKEFWFLGPSVSWAPAGPAAPATPASSPESPGRSRTPLLRQKVLLDRLPSRGSATARAWDPRVEFFPAPGRCPRRVWPTHRRPLGHHFGFPSPLLPVATVPLVTTPPPVLARHQWLPARGRCGSGLRWHLECPATRPRPGRGRKRRGRRGGSAGRPEGRRWGFWERWMAAPRRGAPARKAVSEPRVAVPATAGRRRLAG